MKRTLIAILVFSATSPAIACSPALFERLDVPLREEADSSRDVAEIQSTEGGEWKIWQGADGATEEIARIDYGEMGRSEARLLVEGPNAYAITRTLYRYSVPIYVEGSMTVRVETDIYMFCDGELLEPSEDFGSDPEYAASAEAARAVFRAEEIADVVAEGL